MPQELKDTPITPDSDPRKRCAVKAVTAAASSSRSQMEGSRSVAETPTSKIRWQAGQEWTLREKSETSPGVRKHRT